MLTHIEIWLSHYSYLNDFTGFRLAALQVCELTVESAMAEAMNGPIRKAHSGIGV